MVCTPRVFRELTFEVGQETSGSLLLLICREQTVSVLGVG